MEQTEVERPKAGFQPGQRVRFVEEDSPKMIYGYMSRTERSQSYAICYWVLRGDMRCMEFPIALLVPADD
jgi:hypothetical protein